MSSKEAYNWIKDTIFACVNQQHSESEDEDAVDWYARTYLNFDRDGAYPPGIAHCIAFCLFEACRGIITLYEKLDQERFE